MIIDGNGFLGQQLFERDENGDVMKKVYSEFCCPKSFICISVYS